MHPYPLPVGHVFGPRSYFDLQHHTGIDDAGHYIGMMAWQARYNKVFRQNIPISGRYDGPTQGAIINAQNHYRIPCSGCLDRELWELLWKDGDRPNPDDPPVKALPVAPKPLFPDAVGRKRGRPKKTPLAVC